MASMEASQRHLDRQIERIGWGLFLIMIGGLWLMPAVPEGTWLAGAGVILIGVNLVRNVSGLPMSTFGLLLGGFALALAVAKFAGTDLPVLPLIFVVVGASLIWSVMFGKTAPA